MKITEKEIFQYSRLIPIARSARFVKQERARWLLQTILFSISYLRCIVHISSINKSLSLNYTTKYTTPSFKSRILLARTRCRWSSYTISDEKKDIQYPCHIIPQMSEVHLGFFLRLPIKYCNYISKQYSSDDEMKVPFLLPENMR